MWIDIITATAVVIGTITGCYLISAAIKCALSSNSTPLQNGYLFVQKGRTPIFFSDHKGANIWIKECNMAGISWSVYALCDGEVKCLGNSKDLILANLN